MKKIVILFAFIFFPMLLSAQPGRPRPHEPNDEEFIEMCSRDMAHRLELEGSVRDSFIVTYAAFRKETNALAKDSRPVEMARTEEEIDNAMQRNFEVSEKLLEIRKRYYNAFKEFLRPSQILRMYRFENEEGRRMHDAPPPR